MNQKHHFKHQWLVWLGALGTLLMAPAGAADDKKNEGWRIEMRRQWFNESRSLNSEPDHRALRENSIRSMQLHYLDAPASVLAAETWVEMGPSAMNMSGWSMGRVAGRNNAIVASPSDDSTVYFGSAAGGVWKTVDAGATWVPIFDQAGTLPIGAITIDPNNPKALWVGTGDKNGGGCAGYFGQGVFHSADGGATWVAKNGSGTNNMPLSIVNSVAVSTSNPNQVLAGGYGSCDSTGTLSTGGVYLSQDGGTTWRKTYSGKVEDMAFLPGTNTVFATSAGVGLMKSTDGGATWNSSSNGMTIGTGRMRLAVAPSNPQIMYVLMGAALYRTTNGGANWSLMNSAACEGQCSYNQAIAVHPSDPNKLLVGSIRFALSTNGGTTLNYLTGSWGGSQKVHQDTHVLTWSKNNPGRFWVGSDGGIWRSDDTGASFVNMNSNLSVTQFYDVAVDFSIDGRMFGGAQDNSSSGRATSKVWGLTYASGDGFMNAIDPSNPKTVLQTSYPNGGFPSVVRSTTGGESGTFSSLPTTGLASGSFPWVTPLATAGTKVWVASEKVYVGTTSAPSFSWSALGGTMDSAATVVTPMQVGTAYVVYAGTSGGRIYFSANAGVAGGALSDVTGNYPGGRVSDVAIDPTNKSRVFITRGNFGGNRLYRSTTGGTTWVGVGAGLPNVPSNTVVIDPLNVNRIFVGTDIGVYESTDNGDSFKPFSLGMPYGVVVQDLEINADPHVMVAATYGRGAWKVALQNGGTKNVPPVAKYVFKVNKFAVSFTNKSTDADGTLVSQAWDFGDGTVSTAANPSHTYVNAGIYPVGLSVTDNSGATTKIRQLVTITEHTKCAGTVVKARFNAGAAQTQTQPTTGFFETTGTGPHTACLTGANATHFDMRLEQWDGKKWLKVADGVGDAAEQTLSYTGAAGKYRYRIDSNGGEGPYTFTFSHPD